MNSENITLATRIGGYTAIVGALCAITGAALWVGSGTDMDRSLVEGDMASYLASAGQSSGLLIANLTIWIVMAFLMGIAATCMASLCLARQVLARIAIYCYAVGVPILLTAYVAWLAIITQLAPEPSPISVQIAGTVGWFSSRAVWIASILGVGIGPLMLALAGRDEWAPRWLVRWSYLTVVAAMLNAAAMLTGGQGLSTYGFLIIPVGVGWMLAAGVALLRRLRVTTTVGQPVEASA